MPGNNSRAVLQVLRERPWWHSSGIQHDVKEVDSCQMVWDMYITPSRFSFDYPMGEGRGRRRRAVNHFEGNRCLVTKKGLFRSIKAYCEKNEMDMLSVVPPTFLLKSTVTPVNTPQQEQLRPRQRQPPEETRGESSEEEDDDQEKIGKRDVDEGEELHDEAKEGVAVESVGVVESDEDDRRLLIQYSEQFLRYQAEDEDGEARAAPPMWILKPAALTNRGHGIRVCSGLDELLSFVDVYAHAKAVAEVAAAARRASEPTYASNLKGQEQGQKRSRKGSAPVMTTRNMKNRHGGWIAQRYIENPLLVKGRKFDIRCFVLLVSSRQANGQPKGYMYDRQYVRLSSCKYSTDQSKVADRLIHLTNDAVQKKSKLYGSQEAGNKMSMEELQAYLDSVDTPGLPDGWVKNSLQPTMASLVKTSIAAISDQINPNRHANCFELLGYDFMVDEKGNVTLLEVNSNPCLEFSCPMLQELLTDLLSDTFRLSIDKMFPPPPRFKGSSAYIHLNSKPSGFQQVWFPPVATREPAQRSSSLNDEEISSTLPSSPAAAPLLVLSASASGATPDEEEQDSDSGGDGTFGGVGGDQDNDLPSSLKSSICCIAY